MRTNEPRLFSALKRSEPSRHLAGTILLRLDAEKKRQAKQRLIFLAVTAFASIIAMIPALKFAVQEWAQSGFIQYFSLLFSDASLVLAAWREFALSLAESLPLMGITAVLSTLFILLWSLKQATKNIATLYSPGHFIS